jgi:hypothetical protein
MTASEPAERRINGRRVRFFAYKARSIAIVAPIES